MNYYTYVGNFSDRLNNDDLVKNYHIPKKREQYDWDPCRYDELCDELKYLCFRGVSALEKEDNILYNNPRIIVERHHRILKKNKKIKARLSIHSDREGPANGPCYSILYYYHIDPKINNGELHFYDEEYGKTPKKTFHPKSGDLIAFDDNIYHCPGEFTTNNTTPVVRGLLAMFVIL
jgi:hypothetical protein